MSTIQHRTAEELLTLYWSNCRKRGDIPKTVHAVIALKGAPQAAGTMLAWGVTRDYPAMVRDRQGDPDKYVIQEVAPT